MQESWQNNVLEVGFIKLPIYVLKVKWGHERYVMSFNSMSCLLHFPIEMNYYMIHSKVLPHY